MKLSAQDTANLNAILSTAAIGGIESIIIEDGVVRGVNEARTFVIISDYNVPAFPQKIGLSRLSSLRNRLGLFATQGAAIEARETERGEINALEISAGRSKVQYRCTATALIKAPRSINDEAIYNVFISKNELKLILDAVKVMTAKTVQLIIKKDRVATFRIADETNDVFESVLETPAEVISGDDMDSVVHNFHADIFHAVMRTNEQDNATIVIGAAGTIRTSINGHEVVVMPKVGEDEED